MQVMLSSASSKSRDWLCTYWNFSLFRGQRERQTENTVRKHFQTRSLLGLAMRLGFNQWNVSISHLPGLMHQTLPCIVLQTHEQTWKSHCTDVKVKAGRKSEPCLPHLQYPLWISHTGERNTLDIEAIGWAWVCWLSFTLTVELAGLD
jgi:hypothetical protein